MRAFLNQPVEPQTGVIECMIRRKKGVMSTVYQAYYEVSTYVCTYIWYNRSILSLGRLPRFCRRRTVAGQPHCEGTLVEFPCSLPATTACL